VHCSNCELEVELPAYSVVQGVDGEAVAHLCGACVTGVLVLKLVLKRSDSKKTFSFEGVIPAECEK
jgi:hypothetical protein